MAIFTAIAAAIFGAGTFLAGVTAFALSAVASIGLSYAARALAGSPPNPSVPENHYSVQGTLQYGGDVPRSFNLGYSSTAGSLVYGNFWGNSGETPNAFLTQVIALSDLPGGSLVEVWVSGEKCTLGDTAHSDYGYPVLEYRKSGIDHVWIKYYDGTQTTADPFLVTKVGSVDRPYESTRVGVGVAYVIATALVDDTLFTGIPTYKFAVSGVPLYDPSKDSTNGGTGSHRYSDSATWGGDGDDLPAVQAYNLLRGFYYNGTWLYGLQGMTAARLPTVNWNAQIAKCRAEIEGPDGDEPTYRTGGQISVNTQIGNTLEKILTGCQGKISEIGGFYKCHLGMPDSPTFSFTDDDILSTEEQNFAPFFGLSDSINGIAATFPNPSQSWNPDTSPPLYDSGFEARDGDRRLLANPIFDFVPYPAQVQRLQKSALEEARRERRHAITLWSKYWFVEPGDIGEWNSTRNGYEDKLFRVDGAVDKANLDVTLNLTEVDPADYDWDHSTEYRPVVGGSTSNPRPEPQGVVDWFAEPTILRDSDGRSRRPAIRMTWDGDMPGVTGVQYEVRLASDNSHVTRGRTDQLAAAAIIVSQSLLPNIEYEVRGQYIPSSPRDMLWSDWLSVTTPDVKFSVLDFDNSLADFVTSSFSDASSAIDKIVQIVGNVVLDALGKSDADKRILRSEIYAQAGSLSASVEQVQQAVATNEEAFGQFQTTVTAALEETSTSVQENATAIATVNGNLIGSYGVKLTVDGYASGFQNLNDGSTSAFTISADMFRIAFPGVTGGAPVPVFQIANVDGVAKLAFRGDMIADGLITASMIEAGTITAHEIAADAITADKIAAGSINTEQLAVNSVDITKLIAGAATKTAYDTIPAALSSSVVIDKSMVVDIRSGMATVTLCGSWEETTPQFGIVPSELWLWVDGVVLKTWFWRPQYYPGNNGSNYVLQDPFTVQITKTGLSAGNHTFRVTGGFISGSPMPANKHDQIGIYITDFRR